MRERLVVVGNGMAGLRFVEELLQRAPDRFAITVIGAEREPAYNRVLLSALLGGEIGADSIQLRPRSWYAANGITLKTGQSAIAVDAVHRAVILRDRVAEPFDRLVLATGSSPIRLKLPGNATNGVMMFRTLADVAQIKRAAAAGTPAVVVGGGLLGIEAAYGLARSGVPVTLVHLMDRLMERQLDAAGARLLWRTLGTKNIRVLLGAETRAIHGAATVEAVELADGRRIACGLVVMAVGVKPNTALAETAGITVGRGMIVDDRLETSVPGIHAVGECAEHRGICYGLVEPAYEQARVLADVLAGGPARYPGSVLATNLKISGVSVYSAGDFEGAGAEAIVLDDEGSPSYRKLVIRGGRLTGVVLVGDAADAPWYLDLIRSGMSIAGFRDALAFGRGYMEAA